MKLAKFFIILSFITLNIFQPSVVSAENLSATCFADPLAAKVGEQVIWHVIPEGGSGFYQYSWTGDDDLLGNTPNISKIYDNDGTKEATVVVSSGGEIVTPTCEVEISEVDPPLSVSCFPQSSVVNLSQEVTWTAEARGGNGKYEYSWSGDENLGGTNGRRGKRKTISKTYDYTGIKTANVIVSSGGQSSSRSCSVTVEPDPLLSGICYPNNQVASVGEPVVWTAEAIGGSGEYEYSWSGTENEKRSFRRRSKQAASTVYENPGVKTVSVTISSGNQSTNESCSVNIVSGSVLGVQNSYGNSSGDFYYDSNSGSFSGYGQDVEVDVGKEKEELPTTSIFSLGWAIYFALSSIFGAIIVFVFILFFNKRAREKKKKTELAFEENGLEQSVSKTIQTEARKKEVILSFEALKVLLEKSEGLPSEALKNLNRIIEEIKSLPIPMVPGEERWPTVSKEAVENFFLRKDIGAV